MEQFERIRVAEEMARSAIFDELDVIFKEVIEDLGKQSSRELERHGRLLGDYNLQELKKFRNEVGLSRLG